MSDKPIQVGDLVMVVRPTTCCVGSARLGAILTVRALGKVFVQCACGAYDKQLNALLTEDAWCEVVRLKRIDPDCLKDDIPDHEELTA